MNPEDPKRSPLQEARRGTNTIFVVAIAVLVIGGLLYFGLGGAGAL